ncbi:MAG TPA: hypothetical protein VFR86_22915 [Burkholderiaceae bacterium]|nr:hypothetical protein [Burkholderiaceae bacterium]
MRRTHQPPAPVVQPPSQMSWTDEKLAALSKEQLLNLLDNLKTQRETRRISEEAAEDLARRIRGRLPARALTVRRKRPRSEALLEASVVQELGSLAAVLGERYDLSVETALQLSADIKGFKPQTMTDPRGEPRTGGAVKQRRMAIDRYISYRVRDSLASLAFRLLPDQPAASGRYVVLATEDLLTGQESTSDSVPPAAEYGWPAAMHARMRAVVAANFTEAKTRFEALIARAAQKLPEQPA